MHTRCHNTGTSCHTHAHPYTKRNLKTYEHAPSMLHPNSLIKCIVSTMKCRYCIHSLPHVPDSNFGLVCFYYQSSCSYYQSSYTYYQSPCTYYQSSYTYYQSSYTYYQSSYTCRLLTCPQVPPNSRQCWANTDAEACLLIIIIRRLC